MAQVSSTEDGLSSVLVKSERKGTGTQGGVAGEQKAFYKTLKAENDILCSDRKGLKGTDPICCLSRTFNLLYTAHILLLFFPCSDLHWGQTPLPCLQLLLQRLLLLLPPPASPTFPLHAVRALLWVLVRGRWVQMPQSGSISAEV